MWLDRRSVPLRVDVNAGATSTIGMSLGIRAATRLYRMISLWMKGSRRTSSASNMSYKNLIRDYTIESEVSCAQFIY